MKRIKLLTLALAGVMALSMTACLPLDAAEIVYDAVFGGGSSGSGSSSTVVGMTAEEKAVAEGVAAKMTAMEHGTPTTAGYLPETKQIAAFFKPEWMMGANKYAEIDIGPDGRTAAAEILKAYDPSRYWVMLRVIEVADNTSVQAETEAFTGIGNFYQCTLINYSGSRLRDKAAKATVTTVKSGEKTYRLLIMLIEYESSIT